MRSTGIAQRPFHEFIGYANCWEDPFVLRSALGVTAKDTVLSITSGGCNTLALLLDDPSKIVALDFNASQNHLLRLKMAAIMTLSHSEKLEVLGVRHSLRRMELYHRIKPVLASEARLFWDENVRLIESGLVYTGRIERYMRLFGRLLGIVIGGRHLRALFSCKNIAAQRDHYKKHVDGLRWRYLFDTFFSKAVLQRVKDKSHFKYVDFVGFGQRFRDRAEHIICNLCLPDNYFFALILLGTFHSERALPPYLLEENHAILRDRLDRVDIVTEDLQDYLTRLPADIFSRFNLSNVFDWISEVNLIRAHRRIVHVARPGARLCWWNTLAVRHLPPEVVEINPEAQLAAHLFSLDRFIYAQFQVGQIGK